MPSTVSYIDTEADHSGEDSENEEVVSNSESEEDDFIIDDDSSPNDNESHMQLDAQLNQDEAENENASARAIANRFNEQSANRASRASSSSTQEEQPTRAPVTRTVAPQEGARPPPKIVTSSSKPIGPQTVFMPEKPSFNIVGSATPALTLAFPVWLGVYSKGSLAEVEMAQAIQYVLNAATTVQQKDGARISVTLWCMGHSASKRGMSYREALKCSAIPGTYLAEIFCQDMSAVKKLSDCINDFRTHLRQGENKDSGTSFITKLKKKIEMNVTRDRFNLIEPRYLFIFFPISPFSKN